MSTLTALRTALLGCRVAVVGPDLGVWFPSGELAWKLPLAEVTPDIVAGVIAAVPRVWAVAVANGHTARCAHCSAALTVLDAVAFRDDGALVHPPHARCAPAVSDTSGADLLQSFGDDLEDEEMKRAARAERAAARPKKGRWVVTRSAPLIKREIAATTFDRVLFVGGGSEPTDNCKVVPAPATSAVGNGSKGSAASWRAEGGR